MSDESNSTVSPVTWFEIGAEDPGAARAFYGDLFGWTFNVTGEYSEISYGPGQPPQGGIQDTSGPGPDGAARGYAIPYVQVTDVAATCEAVEQRGGKILIPATSVPNGLSFAHVTDPFGNHFGLFTPPS
jgi:predicted enzyme related to lactoylglutathione lyase